MDNSAIKRAILYKNKKINGVTKLHIIHCSNVLFFLYNSMVLKFVFSGVQK